MLPVWETGTTEHRMHASGTSQSALCSYFLQAFRTAEASCFDSQSHITTIHLPMYKTNLDNNRYPPSTMRGMKNETLLTRTSFATPLSVRDEFENAVLSRYIQHRFLLLYPARPGETIGLSISLSGQLLRRDFESV